MIKVVTQILRLFQGVFTRMGVDFDRMLAIVTVKLTVDNRIDRVEGKEKYIERVDATGYFYSESVARFFFLPGIASGGFRGVAFVISVVPVPDVVNEFYDGVFPNSF